MHDFSQFEKNIGYTFSDKELLKTALTHSSYINEHGMNRRKCNERLEFLGDAVLELISSEFLFNGDPDIPEGETGLEAFAEAIRLSLLADKQDELYNKTVEDWTNAAKIVYNQDKLEN